VITFADPSGAKKLITHRVKSVSLVGRQARFVTQGDANTGTESWTIAADGKVGMVEHRIPKVGYVTVYARTRADGRAPRPDNRDRDPRAARDLAPAQEEGRVGDAEESRRKDIRDGSRRPGRTPLAGRHRGGGRRLVRRVRRADRKRRQQLLRHERLRGTERECERDRPPERRGRRLREAGRVVLRLRQRLGYGEPGERDSLGRGGRELHHHRRQVRRIGLGLALSGGQTYNWRSALLTANGTLSAGTYNYGLALADGAANSRTQTGSVVVDNTAPTGSDVQTANGGTVNKPDTGDTVVYTFSEQIDPSTIKAGWDGSSTAITVTVQQATPRDRLGTNVNLGTIDLRSNAWVTADAVFNATMVMSGATVTVTLGSLTSGSTATVATASALQWTPVNIAADRAGNACSTTTVTESGRNDADF